jgi:hypothetical protein
MKQIRRQLQHVAQHEPARVQPFISLLDTQLRNYAKGSAEGKAALRPVILDNIKRLEASRDGR